MIVITGNSNTSFAALGIRKNVFSHFHIANDRNPITCQQIDSGTSSCHGCTNCTTAKSASPNTFLTVTTTPRCPIACSPPLCRTSSKTAPLTFRRRVTIRKCTRRTISTTTASPANPLTWWWVHRSERPLWAASWQNVSHSQAWESLCCCFPPQVRNRVNEYFELIGRVKSYVSTKIKHKLVEWAKQKKKKK